MHFKINLVEGKKKKKKILAMTKLWKRSVNVLYKYSKFRYAKSRI